MLQSHVGFFVREQLEHFRTSRLEVGVTPVVTSGGISTEAMLAEHREWLRRFHCDVRRVMSNSDVTNVKALPSDVPSLYPSLVVVYSSSLFQLYTT